ncbi:hypothetical protein G6F57_008564 [Rhizopus arrhizus]|nr:hypothetical protein G6F57_008564 [Rhizopus arrhizus]
MDLGINGRWALVCGASKGLGLGCARALVREGVNVVIVARGEAALQHAAEELRALPGAADVRSVAADVTTEAGRAAALAACPQLRARRLDRRAGRQHAGADRTDPRHRGRDDRSRLWPHRQHHLLGVA